MNGVYLRALPPDEYADALLRWLREQGIDWPEETVRATVPLVQEKIEKLSQYPDYVRFLFEPVSPDGADPESRRAAAEALEPRRAVGGAADRGGAAALADAARAEAAAGVRADPARGHRLEGLAGLFESLELLGREESLARLRRLAQAEAA